MNSQRSIRVLSIYIHALKEEGTDVVILLPLEAHIPA